MGAVFHLRGGGTPPDSPRTLRKLHRRGVLRTIRVGRCLRFDYREVVEALTSLLSRKVATRSHGAHPYRPRLTGAERFFTFVERIPRIGKPREPVGSRPALRFCPCAASSRYRAHRRRHRGPRTSSTRQRCSAGPPEWLVS